MRKYPKIFWIISKNLNFGRFGNIRFGNIWQIRIGYPSISHTTIGYPSIGYPAIGNEFEIATIGHPQTTRIRQTAMKV